MVKHIDTYAIWKPKFECFTQCTLIGLNMTLSFLSINLGKYIFLNL